MRNYFRLPRNCVAIIAIVGCAVFFASCDNVDWPTYTVYFDSNGGTGSVPSQRVPVNQSYIRLPDGGEFSRDGFVLSGGIQALIIGGRISTRGQI